MLNINEIKQIIADTLYDADVIDKELYLKCGKPKYISDLPGDLRSNDADELDDRLNNISDELDKREEILKRAEYRIGVKNRDTERLGKRIEKTISAMDKSVDNINSESDKIVKGIDKLDAKLNKIDIEDKSLKDSIDSSLKSFKDAHNKLFDKDLSGSNIKEYRGLVSDYEKKGSDLNNILKDALDSKLINKTEFNASDISKNIARINKNIDKYEENGKKVTEDVRSAEDNQKDIEYITNQSKHVVKEMDILMDEFERTNNRYADVSKGSNKREAPNPQMILEVGAKKGDTFTLLPDNYASYMV